LVQGVGKADFHPGAVMTDKSPAWVTD
jgi:hypothetical protein